MDLLWWRRAGAEGRFLDWEITRSVESWDKAPAPAQAGRKLIRAVTGSDVPLERAPALTNVMHWAYGTAWSAAYAVLAGRRRRPLWAGPAFGALVWGSDYVSLPLAGVYQPIWRYDVGTLWQDLSAHLVFGSGADGALRLLGR